MHEERGTDVPTPPLVYECACGFTSVTATAFYRHLAQLKDAPGKHQLVQAKVTDATTPHELHVHRSASEVVASRIPAAPAIQSHPSQPALARPPSASSTRLAAAGTPAQRSSLMSYPSVAMGSQSPRESSLAPLPTTSPQPQLKQRRQRTQQSVSDVGNAAAAGDPASVQGTATVELDCTVQQEAPPSSTSISTNAFLMQASSVFGSLVMYGLNPIRMFGLSDALGQQGQDKAAGAPMQQSQPPQVSGSASSSFMSRSTDGQAAEQLIASVAAVLTWRDPWRTFRVLAMMLYMGICLQQLFSRSLPVLPSTALLAAALLYLAQNALRAALQPASPAQQNNSQHRSSAGGSVADVVGDASGMSQDARERQVYHSVHATLEAAAGLVIPVVAATAVLVHRALSGRRLATTAVTALFLWTAMVLAELRVFNQLPFTMMLVLAAFTIPAVYVRSREGLDKLVEDVVRLLLRLLLRSSRWTLTLSAMAALLVTVCTTSWNLVLRATAALLSSLAVLLWQARPSQHVTAGGGSR